MTADRSLPAGRLLCNRARAASPYCSACPHGRPHATTCWGAAPGTCKSRRIRVQCRKYEAQP
jgi:hypothetical protein